MNLDHPTRSDILLGQKVLNFHSLIALQLNDFAEFLILDDASVATELLLEGLGELSQVEFIIQPLDSSKRLAAVTLLQTDVNNTLGHNGVITVGIRKRVERRGHARKCGIVAH